jgi:transposase
MTHGKGRSHDFAIYKRSRVAMREETECLADKGYQGIKKYHGNSKTPIKKRKGMERKPEEREWNREVSRRRIQCENVIGKLKVFRIVSERYRNRRRRFGLRMQLIGALYNRNLSLSKPSTSGSAPP